jgi:hypothetical protein
MLSAEQAGERMDICKACPELKGGKCEICHCNMNIKTKLPSQTCPLDKWPTLEKS